MENSSVRKSSLVVPILLLTVFVGLFVGIGVFAHPSADDYAHFMRLQKSGFWGAQVWMWNEWSSRFTTFFIINLGYMLGVMEHYSLHICTWVIFSLFSIYFLISTIIPDENRSSKIFLTLLLQSLWFLTAIGLNETLYWYSGSPYYYTVAFILLEIAFTIKIVNGIHPNFYFTLCALSIILNSGISELAAAYHLPMFAFAALVCYLSDEEKQKEATKYMLILLGVAFVFFLVQLLNSGNATRADFAAETLGLQPKNFITTAQIAFFGGALTTFEFFTKPIIYVALLFVPLFAEKIPQISFVKKLPFKLRIWHIVAFEILTACGFQAISGYAKGVSFPPRAVGTVIWIMAAQWIFYFVFCYRNEKFVERIKNMCVFKWRVVLLALCFVLNGNFISLVNDWCVGAEFSRQLNERYALIAQHKANGKLDIVVPELTVTPKLFFLSRSDISGEETHYWRNTGYAGYFGLDSVRALPSGIVAVAMERNTEKELGKATELAEAGDVSLQIYLAQFYDHLSGDRNAPHKNKPAALKMYIMAAGNGHKPSQRSSAGMLRRGWGTPDGKPDYAGAAKWYLKWLFW